ncbi:PilN domain-containing protein [Pseudocitrobacter cyperus]|uniref:PilN domain-containing protein n=1 Tax=Pseudocitrobacter cyperus TaxID=3112843 RepID=A0ABV0HNW1_9ENTR
MTTRVNFLPWRQSRLRRRRFRGCLIVAGMLLLAMVTGGIRLGDLRLSNAALAQKIEAERQLLRALTLREEQLNARQQAQKLLQREASARLKTLAWQARLQALAAQLPEQAWLTGLGYQNDVLTLSGVLNRFSALHALDETMQHIAEFHPAVAGKMTRDDAGRWLFNYQIKRSVADAAP